MCAPLAEFARRCGVPPGAVPAEAAGLADLLRTAPVARYWTSAASARCTECHGAVAILPDAHDHGEGLVQCFLCARSCVLSPGERGACRARVNDGGTMRSLVYGRPVAVHVDPIEKKPFYHFLPGSEAYSLGTAGCPLRCEFCQNWEISQTNPEHHDGPFVEPARVVEAAKGRAPIIAFTYNEPTVFTEYLTDIARAARPEGLRCALVSCGFMNEAPLAELCETLDAIKIDLKGFSEDFYRRVSGAELKPVLRSIRQIARSRAHLEIVNLVVPALNDAEPMLRGLAEWIGGEIGPDVPVHFTRFHPDYRLLNLPPTPVETLERAREIALAHGLRYAYVGNVPGHEGNHTYCPVCHAAVIRRTSFFVEEIQLKDGACAFCGTAIAGVWS